MSKFIEAYEMGCEDTNRLDSLFSDELSDISHDEFFSYVEKMCDDYDKCKEFLEEIYEIRRGKK